jgi:hypothetical protein
MAGWENPLARHKRQQSEQAKKQGLADPYIVAPELPDIVVKSIAQSVNHAVFYKFQLEQDLLRLKAISSENIPAKIELKKQLVKNYEGLIKGFLAGSTAEKSVVAQIMIWLFDIGEIENALATAFRLIQINQPMPRQFSSDMKTFVCDYTYDWANGLLKKGLSASPYLDSVVETIDADFWDLSPPVASKMYALLAKFKFAEEKIADVVRLCEKAELVNPEGHGTKTLKAQAQKKL